LCISTSTFLYLTHTLYTVIVMGLNSCKTQLFGRVTDMPSNYGNPSYYSMFTDENTIYIAYIVYIIPADVLAENADKASAGIILTHFTRAQFWKLGDQWPR